MLKRQANSVQNTAWVGTILASTVMLSGCFGNKGLPQPGTPEYKQTVSAFTIGTVALETANLNLIEPNLKKSTELAPGEPATWANLGLHFLRTNRTPEAEAAIKKANELGGTSEGLTMLSGLLAEKNGKFGDALALYRKAADANPRNVKAWYLVAQMADRESGADRVKIMAEAQDKIIAILPGNTKALLDRIRTAADANDRATITQCINAFGTRTNEWPERARALFGDLQRTSASGAPMLIKRTTAMLENTLGQYPDFQASKREIAFEGANVGQPLARFVKLQNPPATASAPDTALSYALPSDAKQTSADYVNAFAIDETSDPIVISALGGKLTAGTAIIAVPAGVQSVVATDLDDAVGQLQNDNSPRDYKLDLVVASKGGLRALDFTGGKLTDRTAKAGLSSLAAVPANGAWTVDFEADGDLDTLVAPASGGITLLLNRGNGTFGIVKNPLKGLTGTISKFVQCDIDADGDNDIFVTDTNGALQVFRNDRSGLYGKRDTPAGLSGIAALAVRESTGDATLDVLAVDKMGAVHVIADAGDGKSWVADKVIATGKPEPTSLVAQDADNNGAIDIVVGNKAASSVFLAKDTTQFVPAPDAPCSVHALVDLNKDGVLDAVGNADGRVFVANGASPKAYKWQAFTLKAKRPNSPTVKINAFGIGGEVEMRAGLLYQKQPITGPQVHIGLGQDATLDIARIIWPSGTAQSEAGTDLKTGPVVADQRLSGSCPFLFTWDGEKMVFVTDCIWRSPLGLKINAQDTAGVLQTEDWVKVRGDQLKAKNGVYPLSITAELQETHFFDTVGLMAVDHPEGTDIWVDERFSPVAPPLLDVIPTKTPQAFPKVVGWKGDDVSSLVAEREGSYVDDFGRSKYQGLTADHWIEMELPATLPAGKPLYVVASGWLHPTDTSINVAMSQNPDQAPPSGLVLEGLNPAGKWVPIRRGLGFPAGKLKTIVLRFDDVAKGITKLRLRTNLEIFWDQLRWAEGIDKSAIKITRAKQLGAELVFRGFSEVRPKDSSSPELPLSYDKLAGCAPVWRDLRGYHTRFGDVTPLVKTVDDRYVIMNAGDEMQLRFEEVPVPSKGLVRDFVFIGDGWEKDGNINTTFGQTVLPLPTHSKADYPKLPMTLQDDPVYNMHPEDWINYHTRYVTQHWFHNALRVREEKH